MLDIALKKTVLCIALAEFLTLKAIKRDSLNGNRYHVSSNLLQFHSVNG